MNNPSTDNRVAKLVVMAQNATQEGKNEEALKCYKAILQIDPQNAEADLYIFLLTPYKVKVYNPHLSEHYNNLISKFQVFLNYLKDKHRSNEELHETIGRVWSDIYENCFSRYNDYSAKKNLLKEIQGHSIRLEAAEKIGDSIIAEFPQLKDIAVEVWGYEVGVIYQSIAKLKDETKYDPEAIDVWEGNAMTYDIYQVVKKILEIDNTYLSPYTYCPQEIKEYFERSKEAQEAPAKKATAEKIRQAKSSKITVLIIVGVAATIFLIWSFVKLCIFFDGFIVFTLFGGLIWIGGIALVWSQVKEAIENAKDK